MRKTFSERGFEDYLYWQNHDKKILQKINDLLKDIEQNGALKGIGKPEPLTGNLQGYFSRRIDKKKSTCLQNFWKFNRNLSMQGTLLGVSTNYFNQQSIEWK